LTVIRMITEKPLLVVLCGPTASGKTRAGIQVATYFNTEILSADSRQFYREMKIGTAFPAPGELAAVQHHFLGHLSITDTYNVSKFESDALALLDTLFAKHRMVLLVGGAGLYINAVCHGIDLLPDPDPEIRAALKSMLKSDGIQALQEELTMVDPSYAAGADLANPARLIRALEIWRSTGLQYSVLRQNQPKDRPFRILKIGITHPREILNERINSRVDQMIADGLVEEATELYPHRNLNALNTVGYKELFNCFEGEWNLETAIDKIKTHTRRYAKRQMTWFAKDADIRWFSPPDNNQIINAIKHNI
jgi:tRNA dimethylallyltransferase